MSSKNNMASMKLISNETYINKMIKEADNADEIESTSRKYVKIDDSLSKVRLFKKNSENMNNMNFHYNHNKGRIIETKSAPRKSLLFPIQKPLPLVTKDSNIEEKKSVDPTPEQTQIPKKDINSYFKAKTLDLNDLIIHTKTSESEYLEDIMKYLLSFEKDYKPTYFLKRHNISSNFRAKMIDWMIEVLCSYKCSDQTFFQAVDIMDSYFNSVQRNLELSDLHITGVASMFLASKYEDLRPLRITIVHEKICHKKIPIQDVIEREGEIISSIKFNISKPTLLDIINILFARISLSTKIEDKKLEMSKKTAIYLSKMVMHDYDLLQKWKKSELSIAIVLASLKISEQPSDFFTVGYYVIQLQKMIHFNLSIQNSCAANILDLAKNFSQIYNGLDNLKRFHSFEMDH